MYERYGDRVTFYGVYIREAHPTDGWRNLRNDAEGITLAQPVDLKDRFAAAQQCSGHVDLSMPLLVDGMDDAVGHAYSAMPDRLYLIDRDGKVAYKGGRGPFGFNPSELRQALVMLLLDQEGAGPAARTRPSAPEDAPSDVP